MLDGNVWQSEKGEKSGFPEMRDSDGVGVPARPSPAAYSDKLY